jgi:tetratricopeptide (TPR) repeat protein
LIYLLFVHALIENRPMSLRLPTLNLFTIAFLLSPLQGVGVAQTAQNSNSSQQTQSTPDRSRGNTTDRKAEADRLSQQALEQHRSSQFQAAMQSFQQALVIYQEIGDRVVEGRTLYNIGTGYSDLGQYPQALEQYRQALIISREVGDRVVEGRTLNNIGAVYDNLGQYPQALEQYQQALVIRREVGDQAGEEATLSNMGVTLLWAGQLAAATKTLFSAIEVQDSLRAPALSDANKVSLFTLIGEAE